MAAAILILAVAYAAGVVAVTRRGRRWPARRSVCWAAGSVAAWLAVTGPLTDAAHYDFTAHAVAHLLLGMVAPLLLVFGAPVTLALRALPVGYARAVSRVLRSGPVRAVTHPVTAALLNGGGLWILYATGLSHAIHTSPWLEFHLLAAGYLFAAAIAGPDPAPHRPGPAVRGVVLVAFMASHAVLAKYLYGHPPVGFADGEAGAQVMYYGGDLVDLVLVVALCREWYGSVAPGRRVVRRPRAPWRLPEEIRTAR
ncbi:cytochrome c oxidase assembly protein [Actinoplanes sp. NPDC023936]|uniref:cytochrome c oxidase assembly protein n=1 Tax=Actinoplanes sp. NPDC023936 TaxID=3154910 RepID=UPI0033E9C9C9